MCDFSDCLTKLYRKRFEDISIHDYERSGVYYDGEKKNWVIYDYRACSELLNSQYVTKKRMLVPLSLFQTEKTLIEHFLELINQSIIFRDDAKSDVVRIIHQNFKKLPCDKLIEETIFLARRKNCLEKNELIVLNDTLAARLVGLEPSRFLAEHAHNVGKLFDGRVQGKEHFVDIARSFITVFAACKKISPCDERISDIQASDRAIAYIAAHQTTMQLIVAALWSISHFNLKVNTVNVRDIVIEASRLYSPVLSVGRLISQDLIFRGKNLKQGDRVMFYTALANFDEKIFDDPFRFIPGRKEKPLSFGTGMHMCIGMGIALSFASSFIAHISANYTLRDVSITEFAEGMSALGASDFNIGIDFNELAEN